MTDICSKVSVLQIFLWHIFPTLLAEVYPEVNSVSYNYDVGVTAREDVLVDNDSGLLAPIEIIEETVVLDGDIRKPDHTLNGNLETGVKNGEKLENGNDATGLAESKMKHQTVFDAQKAASADDVKLYFLVQRLLNETPLVDGHNDLPWNLRKFLRGQLAEFNFDSDLTKMLPWSRSNWSHTDLPRLRRGRVGAQVWVAYAQCNSQNKDAVQVTLEQIDLITRLIGKYPDTLKLALSAKDIVEAQREGKIASVIAVEGGHSLGNSLATLRAFYDLGVRVLTLTHSCNTPWADSVVVDNVGKKPQIGGLTEFGRTVVKEMNRLGMLVDLSHTAMGTMLDAIKVSKAPVIFSHSGAYTLCAHPRNVRDEVLQDLVGNGGIVMVSFYNQFVTCGPNATVSDVAEHINYIKGRIGVDRIGIGSGFDGIDSTPEGLKDVSMYPNLFVELARNPGWSNGDLKKVAGENFLRVFREAEHVRDVMRSDGVLPYQDYPIPRYDEEAMRCRYNHSTASNAA